MKKALFTILTVSLLLSSSSLAQFGFKIGPKAGINLANLSFDPDLQSGIEKSSKLGFKFGAAVELGFIPMFAVQIEPMYVQKGAKVEGPIFVDQNNQPVNGSVTFNATFIEIPILLKLKIPTPGGISPYFFVGPDIGILLSSNQEFEAPGFNQENDTKETTSSIDFVLDIGAGVGFSVGPIVVLTFDARYALGLSDLNDNPQNSNQSIKSTGIQILVGAMFGL
ncbi:MAG: porin family protein [Ignavibacteria bacterium]|nr:porin family protein [Ignavibacteria bacterium]